MAKKQSLSQKRKGRRSEAHTFEETTQPIGRAKSLRLKEQGAQVRRESKPLKFLTENQGVYHQLIESKDITLGLGPAGTGKTYVCVKHGALGMDRGRYDKIVVVRPIVEASGGGKGMGFLPGDIGEKTAPYQQPFLEVLEEHYGKSHLENLRNGQHPKVFFIAPEHIRGRTFRNALVILDEAQNMTFDQLITFVTRMGENSKVVINGDPLQCDLPAGRSGLKPLQALLDGLDEVGTVDFVEEDIVRHGLVRKILIRHRRSLALKAGLPVSDAVE